MATPLLFEDTSRNPLSNNVLLNEQGLRVGSRAIPAAELQRVAMADAFLRGCWLGGGGTERPLAALPAGKGAVPVIRVTGSSLLVKTRRAAEFAHRLGELAVRLAGGPQAVAQAAARAAAEGVPLWLARRQAPGPAGPVTVTVDRRLVRADVWTPGAPAVRLRGPYGLPAGPDAYRSLAVTVGDAPAQLVVVHAVRRSRRAVVLRTAYDHWELTRQDFRCSRLTRNGPPVAELAPPPRLELRNALVLPLGQVRYLSLDPLDVAVAHFFAVCFGLGDNTGRVRFGVRRQLPDARREADLVWQQPWYSGLGSDPSDSGPGGGGDGWSGDGGGGDGGGGDGGGGDGGGGGGGGGE